MKAVLRAWTTGRLIFAAQILLIGCWPAAATRAQDQLPELVRRIKPSAVAIETFDSRGEKLSRGSGFFIDADRIVTNRHVIEGAHRAEVHSSTGIVMPVKGVLAIDYEAEQGPTIAVRLQELFGLNTHPSIAAGKVPLVLELLSPAQRPVQVTRDLPGFWRGSYSAVRSDLRGRYPRHPWPDDPASALPTRRAKPRGT